MGVAGAILAIAACSRMDEEKRIEPSGLQEITISAYSSEAGTGTRTSRDYEGTFYWSPEDRISLFYGSGENGGYVFTSTNSEAAQVAEFRGYIDILTGNLETGGETRTFWGVYPYSEKTCCYGSYLVTEVPSVQVAAEETFADGQFVSIGCSSGLDMGFYHLCGGIKFYLQDEGISRISLRGNQNEVLGGIVEVMLDEKGCPYVNKVYEGETTIVLTPPEGESYFRAGVNYFIVTLPVTFMEGFTATFEREDMIGTRYVGVELPVHRAKFQWSEKPLDYEVQYYPLYMDVEEQDIVNPEVRRYLEEVDYSDDPGYTYTKVEDYNGSDKPEPVYLHWNGTASQVILSKSRSFDDDVLPVEATESPAAVYNLVPGVPYYYRAVTDSGVQEGCIMPVGPLRMIKANAASNMRDLGGWGTLDGRSIGYGRLYRGTQTGTADHDLFVSLGIDVDLDLRGNGGGSARQVFSDLEYLNLKVYQFMYNGSTPGYTEELYREALRRIIAWLQNGQTVYFHCIGGADRTGTLAFLIEALLGVDENDLNKDYELTYFSSQPRTRDDADKRPFKELVFYMRSFPGKTLQEQVTAWATTGDNALTYEEIDLLKSLMLEK